MLQVGRFAKYLPLAHLLGSFVPPLRPLTLNQGSQL